GRPQWTSGTPTSTCASPRRTGSPSRERGRWRMALPDAESGSLAPVDLPYTHIRFLRAAAGRALVLAGSPSEPKSLVLLDLDTRKPEMVRRSIETANDP